MSKLYNIALVVLLLATGCRSALLVEHSPEHKNEASKIKKIISLDPEYRHWDLSKGEDISLLKSEDREAMFSKSLVTNAKRAGIELVLIQKEELGSGDLDYFNIIAPLKQQIMIANTLQDVSLGRTKGGNYMRPPSKEFKDTPIFTSEYSHLAKKYGTPYFAVHGLFSVVDKRKIPWAWWFTVPPVAALMMAKPNAYTYYYTAVVNIETSEVLYREVRYVNRGAIVDVVDPMVYDSFRILEKPVKK